MENLFFTCRVVVGFWRHSNQQASCFGHDIIFSSKKSEVETKNPQKERCDSNALWKTQFVFILEFFWVEVAFLESQDHYLQNLEKRSVVVQVALWLILKSIANAWVRNAFAVIAKMSILTNIFRLTQSSRVKKYFLAKFEYLFKKIEIGDPLILILSIM